MGDVRELLWRLSINRASKGYLQLAFLLELLREKDEYPVSFIKLLYPEAAKAFGTTPDNIEHNLRTVITVCWERGNRSFLDEVAGYHITGKPTTKEFIEILATYLSR